MNYDPSKEIIIHDCYELLKWTQNYKILIKNANYRVRSGYTGPTMKNGQLGIGEYEHNEMRKR